MTSRAMRIEPRSQSCRNRFSPQIPYRPTPLPRRCKSWHLQVVCIAHRNHKSIEPFPQCHVGGISQRQRLLLQFLCRRAGTFKQVCSTENHPRPSAHARHLAKNSGDKPRSAPYPLETVAPRVEVRSPNVWQLPYCSPTPSGPLSSLSS